MSIRLNFIWWYYETGGHSRKSSHGGYGGSSYGYVSSGSSYSCSKVGSPIFSGLVQ